MYNYNCLITSKTEYMGKIGVSLYAWAILFIRGFDFEGKKERERETEREREREADRKLNGEREVVRDREKKVNRKYKSVELINCMN